MNAFIQLLAVTNLAQVVLPYDPSTMPVVVAGENPDTSYSALIGLGFAGLLVIAVAILLIRKLVKRRRYR